MKFKPMLATNIEIDKLRLPVMASKKLEGVRLEFTPDGLKTRPMKRFNNRWLELHFGELVQYCKDNNIYVEAEAYCHGKTFNEISSICRRANHPDTGDLKAYIFDYYNERFPSTRFQDRYEIMKEFEDILGNPDIRVSKQYYMHDTSSIMKFYETALEDGYEGLCFKDINGTYKKGRSTQTEQKFLRIKPENTYDGVVTEIVERFENLVESEYNELGYLSKKQDKDQKAHTGLAAVAITKCSEFDDPIRVTLSRGLSDNDRKKIWENRDSYIGKNIRFVGIPVPGMLPRAPRFDAWRTDLD